MPLRQTVSQSVTQSVSPAQLRLMTRCISGWRTRVFAARMISEGYLSLNHPAVRYRWGTELIKALAAAWPELSKVSTVKPGVKQDTALHASPAARKVRQNIALHAWHAARRWSAGKVRQNKILRVLNAATKVRQSTAFYALPAARKTRQNIASHALPAAREDEAEHS